jgi:hypothetical protein
MIDHSTKGCQTSLSTCAVARVKRRAIVEAGRLIPYEELGSPVMSLWSWHRCAAERHRDLRTLALAALIRSSKLWPSIFFERPIVFARAAAISGTGARCDHRVIIEEETVIRASLIQ